MQWGEIARRLTLKEIAIEPDEGERRIAGTQLERYGPRGRASASCRITYYTGEEINVVNRIRDILGRRA